MSSEPALPASWWLIPDVPTAQLYIDTFFARDDDFAWHKGFCWVRVGRPVTPDDVRRAFANGPPLSTYTQDSTGWTHVFAGDFDSTQGYNQARAMCLTLWLAGIPAYVERSRAGRAHTFVTVDRQIPASCARRVIRWALARNGLDPILDHIELRPASDQAPSPGGVGSGLRAAMMTNPKDGTRNALEDPRTGQPPGDGTLSGILGAIQQASGTRLMEIGGSDPIPGRTPSGSAPSHIVDFNDNHSVIELLNSIYGIAVEPDSQIRCPAHHDLKPSAHIYGDRRIVCFVAECELVNDGRGRDAWDLAQMAASQQESR